MNGYLVVFRAPHDDVPGPVFSSREYADSYLDRLGHRALGEAQRHALAVGFPAPERLISVDLLEYVSGTGPRACVRSLPVPREGGS